MSARILNCFLPYQKIISKNYKVIGEVTDSDVVELTLENGFVERIENVGYEHYVSE